MKPDDTADPGQLQDPGTARHLTPAQMKAVIRRADELQAASGPGGEDVSEAEMVRIGQELGIDPVTVRRAMAEVRSQPTVPTPLLKAIGDRFARGQRVVPLPADRAAARIDRYLRESELMVVERRYPDRIRYALDSSIGAMIRRIARRFSRSHPNLGVERVDVAVSALDEGSALVDVSADLRGPWIALPLAALGIGLPLAIIVFATNSITDPWMLLGLLLLVGPWLFFRAIYAAVHRSTRERVESLLDRIAHEETDRESADGEPAPRRPLIPD